MPDDIDLTEATAAALQALGWPDDRDSPGGDGVPAAAHWTAAGEVVEAVAPLLVAEARRRALSEAYRRIREHASGYRGAELFRRTRERWEASGRHDKDALAKVVTHEFFARGLEKAAGDVGDLLGITEDEEPPA